MERAKPVFEGRQESPTFATGPEGFVDGYLKKRRRQGADSITAPEITSIATEATVEHQQSEAEGEPSVMRRFRMLGERTLTVVFEARDRLVEPEHAEHAHVPEVDKLEEAADDVDEALITLDEAEQAPPRLVRIDAPAEMKIERKTPAPEAPQNETVGPVEQASHSEWTRSVKAAARTVSDEMSNRFERFHHKPKRAASAAELGVVAVLLGGALGMLFVAERRTTSKERAVNKKQQALTTKLEHTLEHQAEVIERQEHRIEQLSVVQEVPLRQVRKEARDVVAFAHKQADTIREVAHEVQDIKKDAILLQNTVEHNKSQTLERPPLVPDVSVELEKPGIIERLKPFVGIESIEQTAKASRTSDIGSIGGGSVIHQTLHKKAKTSQKVLGRQFELAKTKIDQAADSPFAWLYGLAMLATVCTIVAVLWVLTR